MILADTSIWVAHFRADRPLLRELLSARRVAMHAFVAGELAMGNLPTRNATLGWFERMPQAPVASHAEVMAMIEKRRLSGRGVGYTDVHLLASSALAPANQLWTEDRRLEALARDLGLRVFEP